MIISRLVVQALSLSLLIPPFAFAEEMSRKDPLFVIRSLGCRGCHEIAGKGGTIGPSLNRIGSSLDRSKILDILKGPRNVNPAATMPSFGHIPPEDLEMIADYLAAQK